MAIQERNTQFNEVVGRIEAILQLPSEQAQQYIEKVADALGLVDDNFKELTQDWEWKEELHVGDRLSVATAFFGKHLVGSEQILNHTKTILHDFRTPEELDEMKAVGDEQGFPELYQISSGLTEQQYLLIEQIAALQLVTSSKEALGQTIAETDLLIFATSIPVSPDFMHRIADFIGLPPTCLIKVYNVACDSSGAALYDVQTGVYDHELSQHSQRFRQGQPANITIFACETPNRFTGVMNADSNSPQLFSSAASAVSFEYQPQGETTFRYLFGGVAHVEEGASCLAYYAPHIRWPEYMSNPDIVFSQHLSEPEEENALVHMDAKETATFFKPNALILVASVMSEELEKMDVDGDLKIRLQEYLSRIGKPIKVDAPRRNPELAAIIGELFARRIKKVVAHHPSQTIFKSLGKQMRDFFGFTEDQIQFVIPEGNAPAVTVPIALGRQMADLERGDNILVISFGAGGSFHCGCYEYLPEELMAA